MMTCYNVPALNRNRNCEFLWTFNQSTTPVTHQNEFENVYTIALMLSGLQYQTQAPFDPRYQVCERSLRLRFLKVHFCRFTRCFLGHGGMPIDIQHLTHWGRVTHICVSNLILIGSDNGLSPGRRQAIIWTNAGILLIGPLGTNFSEILIEICIFSFKEMHLKMSSWKWWPFCLGLNVLTYWSLSDDMWGHIFWSTSGQVIAARHQPVTSTNAVLLSSWHYHLSFKYTGSRICIDDVLHHWFKYDLAQIATKH